MVYHQAYRARQAARQIREMLFRIRFREKLCNVAQRSQAAAATAPPMPQLIMQDRMEGASACIGH
jgi:hypothetical protein